MKPWENYQTQESSESAPWLKYTPAESLSAPSKEESKKTSSLEEAARPILKATKGIVVGGLGGLGDLAQEAVNLPGYLGNKATQLITGDEKAQPFKPIFGGVNTVSPALRKGFDELTGGLTAPRNKGEEALEIGEEIAGGLVSPAAVAKGVQTIGKAVGNVSPKSLLQKATGITKKSEEALKAFEEAGVDPRLADITEGQTSKTFQNLLGNFPGSRGVIEKATQNQINDITKQLAGITKSEGGTIQETGKVIQKGATNVKEALEARTDNLYRNLDKFIPAESSIPTKNLQALAQDQYIQDVAAVGGGDTTKVLNRLAEIVDENGQIPYDRLRIFRSTLGKKLQSPSLGGDDRSALKKIYGALSEDMKEAIVANSGEKGLQSFNKANNAFARYSELIDSKLNPLIEAKTPEAVYSMAMSGSKQGGSNIRGIMKTLDPQQKEFVRGTVTKRMGLASAGEQDATGEVFNPNKFLTEWNKLSPEAKANLYEKGQITAIDNLNKVVSRIKETTKAKQSSNNLPYLSWLGLGALGGSAGIPTAAALVGGAHITAKMMTNPRFVRWLATAPEMKTPQDISRHLSLLSKIAATNAAIREDTLDYLKSITIP